MPEIEDTAVPRLSLLALFAKFLRFGMLAFGGPVAQIAMIRQSLVAEENWIPPARFNRLLAVMQILPGPEAHELCVHMGMMARGRIGGLLAGLGFMLPGFLLMLACGWAYAEYIQGQEALSGILLGVQVAVLAVIARSVQRIGQHILNDLALWGFAAVAAVATLVGVPFWVPLVACALAYSRPTRPGVAIALAAVIVVLAWLLVPASDVSTVMNVAGPRQPVDTLALFLAGLKGGMLTFGGAYTAIPYVRADTVGRGWLGDGAFLDGVALANVLPAPLVIFATFAGYLAGGFYGALATTAGMFLPAFAFSLVFYERLESIVDHPRLHRLLDGVAAAAVGIIAATLISLAISAVARLESPLLAAPIFLVALFGAWMLKGKWVTPAIVAAGAVAGGLLLT
ncbi:chromate efflux transporter [Croceicoccus sp. BE223]|uniref:chromate efflux transporter n=1 Tax=Croceicoccus sp. BE223 TaxID=2817716 RepID=UPI0028609756|nr:chromate efflux transporter [Croceicoccus sp. BE223]MDR7102854.1 chromate transporter [Croceicoccus sp. BE223]